MDKPDTQHAKTTNDAPPTARHLVAVPDPDAGNTEKLLYRLGIQSADTGATLRLGEDGPAGQRLPWIYLSVGESLRYELDLDAATLTVVITNPDTGEVRVMTYNIDVQAMTDQEITAGQPVTIVFAYDGELTFDVTPEIDQWCATTGPRYTEELLARLRQLDNVVVDIEEARARAKTSGTYREATTAPKSARKFDGNHVRDIETENSKGQRSETADVEVDLRLPEGVQIYDPISGKTFVGRRWAREHEQTTLQALIDGGYRLAVVRFRNGDIATLMPNFSGRKMAIQIKSAKGTIGRVLSEKANTAPLGPGHRIYAEMSHTTTGDPSVKGQMLTTPAIMLVVGIGPEAKSNDLPYPPDNTLAEFRRGEAVQQRQAHNLQRQLNAG